MRAFFKSGTMTLAAALIGGTALVSAPALSASEPFQLAQMQRDDSGAERGGRGGGEARGAKRGGRGGGEARGAERGNRGGGGGEMRGSQQRGGEMRGGQARGGDSRINRAPREQIQRSERAPRSNIDRSSRMRVEQRREIRRDDRRWDRREVRGRAPFVYLGGSRIVVREYGPGWCRGLHRGYHRAPRVGWHNATHRGLYRF